jgi:hypothetical protein
LREKEHNGVEKGKGKRVTKGYGICGRKGIKGVEKGDKELLKSFERLKHGGTG